jgi:hypothetical protein
MAAHNLTGRVFGRWKVLRRDETKPRGNGHSSYWTCWCLCGTVKPVVGTTLVSGKSKACPQCAERPLINAQKKHGEANNSPEYAAWLAMKNRCSNPMAAGFENYGGRGITVCDRWIGSFETFLADMGRKPTATHSIDRIDNDGNYEPSNCKWASRAEQNRNSRRNQKLTFQGRTMTVAEWSVVVGIDPYTLYKRLYRGWSTERLLSTPAEIGRNQFTKPGTA